MNTYKWFNTVSFLVMLCINMLANILPIAGNTTGQVSSAYNTLFTPAPYTFSIWGLIYLLMLIFVLRGFRKKSPVPRTEPAQLIGYWFGISCILNSVWIICWHYRRFVLSFIIIVLLLLVLVLICMSTDKLSKLELGDRLSVTGFSIYMGWLIAASIANLSVLLASMNAANFRPIEHTWTLVVIICAAIVGTALNILFNHRWAALAICWALIGILVKHMSSSGFNHEYKSIIIVLAVSIAIILLTSVLSLTRERKA